MEECVGFKIGIDRDCCDIRFLVDDDVRSLRYSKENSPMFNSFHLSVCIVDSHLFCKHNAPGVHSRYSRLIYKQQISRSQIAAPSALSAVNIQPRSYPRYFPTIGMRRPEPNAFGLTLNTGAICARFHSLLFTILRTRFTRAASNPIAIISFGASRCSMYA